MTALVLVLVLLWIGLAVSIVAVLAIVARRADQSATGSQPIGVHNLPVPANDYGLQAKHHRPRSVVIVVMAVVLASYSGRVQAQTVALSPLHVTAPSSCVDVQVEGARSISFDCLNQQLKADAQDQGNAPPTAIAKDAAGNGAPTTVGTFSYTGTSIRMGSNFGKSAFPQRPPAPSFTSALVPAGAR